MVVGGVATGQDRNGLSARQCGPGEAWSIHRREQLSRSRICGRGQSVTYSPSFKMKLSLSLVAFITLQVVIGIPVPADNPCAGFSKLVVSDLPFSLMQARVLFHLVIDPITKLGWDSWLL